MDKINQMNPLQLIRYFKNIDTDTLKTLLDEKEKLLAMDSEKFNLLFLNITNNYKKMLLDDIELFDKIMNIPPNRMGKTIIDLSDKEIQEYIYNHINLQNSLRGIEVLEYHLRKLTKEELTRLLENNNLNQIYSHNIQNILPNIDGEIANITANAIASNQLKPIAIFGIHNKFELLIYAKFQILVTVSKFENGYLYIGDKSIPYDFIKKVNRKHILSLFSLSKDKNNCMNNEYFISILKLYMIFGLDNSKKILNDFFTFSTSASIKKASEELFKDLRREYRLKNQDKYYYYHIEDDFLNAFYQKNINYFKEFCMEKDDMYIQNFLIEVYNLIKNLEYKQQKNIIKGKILEEIQKRENYFQKKDITKYQKYYENIARKEKISIKDIYQLIGDINLEYQLSKDGKIVPNEELTKFLLGNTKRDNDCLFRMAMNHQALGLNDELDKIMNHFDEIQKVIANNQLLSIYSILDIIDISKVFLYHLKPNELDITLDTLSKILKSRKYCTESPEVILKRVMTLHKERKKKISCAIDVISTSIDNATIRIAEPDEENLLVSGIETGSCFKVGGKGEDFFWYCLTSPLGLVLYLEYKNIKYVVPCTINGNMLNVNSIDPRILDENLYKQLVSIIAKFSKIIVDDPRNDVELVTITDIHHDKFMKNMSYKPLKLDCFIPLGTDVYCDYNKTDVINYCICRKNKEVKPKYFNNEKRFYQSRIKPYIFSPNHEDDQERIELFINNIAYSSIEIENLTVSQLKREKDLYIPYEVCNFIYIVGNKDWFIGIDKSNQVIKYCLPYDERGKLEFQKYEILIQDVLENIDEYTLKR